MFNLSKKPKVLEIDATKHTLIGINYNDHWVPHQRTIGERLCTVELLPQKER